MRKPTKSSLQSLSRIIWRLEAWQNREDVRNLPIHHDTNRAKNLLMDTQRRMEHAKETGCEMT